MSLVTLVVVLSFVILALLGVVFVMFAVCKLYQKELRPIVPPVKSWVDAYWEEDR